MVVLPEPDGPASEKTSSREEVVSMGLGDSLGGLGDKVNKLKEEHGDQINETVDNLQEEHGDKLGKHSEKVNDAVDRGQEFLK